MNYQLLQDIIQLIQLFGTDPGFGILYTQDVKGFCQWVADSVVRDIPAEPDWEGKDKGRTAESVINTLVGHMNRYARTYAKSAIQGSDFSTQEEFIYLINLKALGPMSKTALIRHNIHDKPLGMQIINRLLAQGWIVQEDNETDRRSKMIQITASGLDVLAQQMHQIRAATNIVTGDLNHTEKMDLIRLLYRLEHFHKPIFNAQIERDQLLNHVIEDFLPEK